MGQRRDRFAARRRAVGHTQESLTAHLGLGSSTTVARWEQGISTPQPWQRPKLAAALRCSLEELDELLDRRRGPDEPPRRGRYARSGTVVVASAPIASIGDQPLATSDADEPGTPAGASPAVTLEELRHVAAALDDARYLDGSVVDYFRRQVVACAAEDGEAGPRHALAPVLGILAAVETHASSVASAIRRDLLAVGARAAELAGWLYRDSGDRALAVHWRDRAFEWAAEAGDLPMCGYVLLKKSQAAWDDRDAVRMLSLAQAAQQPTWHIPPRVHAEAAQQEARGHAMLGHPDATVDRTLDEAHSALTAFDDDTVDAEESLRLGAHYDDALLAMQTAICWSEAGKLASAVELYRGRLSESRFSRRDYGYFLSLMAATLAAADEVQEAARTGMRAHQLAIETDSTRTLSELRHLAARLSPWAILPDVRDLQEAVLAG